MAAWSTSRRPSTSDTGRPPRAHPGPRVRHRPHTSGPAPVPAWRIEEPVYVATERGPARIVHRGDCRALRDLSRPATTEPARAVLEHRPRPGPRQRHRAGHRPPRHPARNKLRQGRGRAAARPPSRVCWSPDAAARR
ncbi:DUF6233 domain-containing protein [Streptomyces sp. DvalAA-14]|uniref:DUF6233 domain-containing protein n=1 Tax=Streptomyces sp. DvalAA-14 TaxID=1839759 RepID=UPI00351E4440